MLLGDGTSKKLDRRQSKRKTLPDAEMEKGVRVSEHELPGEMDIELDMDILGLASL